jgi:phytoene dehydrogenase-like protein
VARSCDVIVIGAGHNGLVTAGYLARAGLDVVVLERRPVVGGAAATEEIAPGMRAPVAAHTVGRLAASVVRDLDLSGHGLELLASPARVFAPQPDGRAVALWADPGRTAAGLRAWSAADARAYGEFDRRVRTLSGLMGHIASATPPDLVRPSIRDGRTGLALSRAFRALGSSDGGAALRVLPMAVADFVAEAFETDALRAAIAARGIQYTSMGPWSAGTTAVLLLDGAIGDGGAPGQATLARGGPGALAAALAASARSFGAEIRTGTEVVRVTTQGGRATGVALASGEELRALAVASGADPKRTLLHLIEPSETGPTLRWRVSNLRLQGAVAKVNLCLGGLPRFTASGDDLELPRGRILVAPGIDALERAFDAAKYGRLSEEPYLEATIPTLSDDSLAPPGRHVMSVVVQYAPYHLRDGEWPARRDELGDLVLRTLERYAPGLSALVEARQVLTPADLERDYGLTEGHPLHGEPGLDQLFAWRPMLGCARYRLPVEGLYLCGSGAHPGGGITGAPGANAAREIYRDLERRR